MDRKKIKDEMNDFMKNRDKKEEIDDILRSQEGKTEKKEIVKPQKHAEYFEGQLQMRNINKEILDYINRKILKAGETVPTVVHHSKKDLDYFVSSKKLIHQLGKELRDKFGGFVKESAQLFTRDHQTSKNLYRLNVFYKTHDIAIHSVIEYKGLPYQVTGYAKDRLIIQDIHSKKKSQISVDDIEKEIEKIKTQVVETQPELLILDHDFQPVRAENTSEKELRPNQHVKAIFSNNTWYVI